MEMARTILLTFLIFQGANLALASEPEDVSAQSLWLFVKSQWLMVEYGVTAESLKVLNNAILADPLSWYLKYALAEAHLEAGAYIKARSILESLARIYPTNLAIQLLLGKSHVLLNELDEAEKVYRKAAKASPTNEEALFHLSLVLAAKRQFNEALKLLKEIEKFTEHLSLTYLYQARIFLELGEEKKAIDALQEAVAHKAENPEVLLLLAILMEGQGKRKEALRYYEEYSQHRPDDLDVLKKLVDLYVENQNYDRAMPMLFELRRLEPDNEKVALKIALIQIELNRLKEARELLQSIIKKNTRLDMAYYYLGVVCQMLEDFSCSQKAYGNVTTGSLYYGDSVLQRALILLGLRQHDKAIDVLQSSQEAGKVVLGEDGALVLSAAHELKGDFDEAVKVLDTFLRAEENNTRMLYAKANVLYKSGKVNKAIETIHTLLVVDSEHVQGLNFLGYHLLTKAKDHEGAYSLIKKAYELSPTDPNILDSWGWYWVMIGQPEKGIGFLEKAFLAKPDDVTILEHLVLTLVDVGSTKKAQEYLRIGHASYEVFTPEERRKFDGIAKTVEMKLRGLASEPTIERD